MARVLVIEDDADLRAVLRLILEAGDHEVLEAPEGESGLALFRARAPDVVLTDILMPGKEGLETILTLRHEAPHAKIIAMSGGGAIVSKQNALRSAADFGVRRTLAKPFSAAELLSAIDAVLRGEDSGSSSSASRSSQ